MNANADPSHVITEVVRLLRGSRDWTARMDEILALLGQRLAISRVFIFEIHELPGGGLGQTCRFDWAAPGLAALVTDPRNVDEPVADDPLFEVWTERRRRGETIHGFTRDLDGYLRQDFEHQRIKSFLSIPIMVNGSWWGHIGFDDCETERVWTGTERSVLESVAYLIGNAIELSGSSLMMSEASRQAMLTAALDGIVVIDEESRILEFNPAAEAMFGRARSGMLGHPIGDCLAPATVDGDPGLRAVFEGDVAAMIGRRIETEGLRADATRLPVELTVTAVRVDRRRLFVVTFRDLTERKAAEAEALRQRNALHQSEKMSALGSLLAGIAHELNNPLSVVVGRAIMLEEDCRDPRQQDQLRRLREAAERCARIAQTFLKMARQTPTARKPVDLADIARSALEMVNYAARSSGVEIRLDLAPGLPPAEADADQLVQVAINLMINAIQAMGQTDGPRLLHVRTRHDVAAGVLVLEVEDTGPGIPAAILPRIFEPFFTTKDVGIGTGVGLAVCQGMVSAHGGHLTAENRPEGGALFRVTLPLGTGAAAAASSPAGKAAAGSLGRRILVVDDEPEVAQLIRDILERAGHSVAVADNGLAALSLPVERFDAIFCDLRMPQMDGRAFRDALSRRAPALVPRLVFVTGDHFASGADAGSLDGCRVIEKPFRAADVLAAIADR